MATQAESLQQLMRFFQVRDGHDLGASSPAAPAPRPRGPSAVSRMSDLGGAARRAGRGASARCSSCAS
jgi:hypothetical protein